MHAPPIFAALVGKFCPLDGQFADVAVETRNFAPLSRHCSNSVSKGDVTPAGT